VFTLGSQSNSIVEAVRELELSIWIVSTFLMSLGRVEDISTRAFSSRESSVMGMSDMLAVCEMLLGLLVLE
jgi:hypothetical protein